MSTGLITDSTKSVQGFAIYSEFTNTAGDIYQMFITPDGTNDEGQFVAAHVFKRRLTSDAQKKQWRTQVLSSQLLDPVVGTSTEEHRFSRLKNIKDTLSRLALRFTIVNEPFFVEVSKQDLSQIAQGKTPIKVIYRIGETRKALGFAEMFAEEK
jgi:hypothetical protein